MSHLPAGVINDWLIFDWLIFTSLRFGSQGTGPTGQEHGVQLSLSEGEAIAPLSKIAYNTYMASV